MLRGSFRCSFDIKLFWHSDCLLFKEQIFLTIMFNYLISKDEDAGNWKI